jgi:hypothetical protein
MIVGESFIKLLLYFDYPDKAVNGKLQGALAIPIFEGSARTIIIDWILETTEQQD